MSMKRQSGAWGAPGQAYFSSWETDDDVPFFSPDGKRLYFVSGRPVSPGASSRKENIWFVEKTGRGWSDPRPVGPGINSLPLHWQFSVASNMNIYFGSDSGGGMGMGDIYLSRYVDGEYSPAENLGEMINSEHSEGSPYVSPDESYMIISRHGQPDGFGSVDLYISFRDEDGGWTGIVNMGEEINSSGQDMCPMVSPDGKYLFYLSNRSGDADIFWVSTDIIGELREKSLD